MARSISRLTSLEADRLVKTPAPGIKAYHDGAGLYLHVDGRQVREEGDVPSASWVFRYMFEGKARMLGLGSYRDVSLKEARRKAGDARQLKARGSDPLAVRDADRAARRADAALAVTFRVLAEDYVRAQSVQWKSTKHSKQWLATLDTYAYPLIGDSIIGAIDANAVLAVLRQEIREPGKSPRPLWESRPETASRLRGRLEAVFAYAKFKRLRDGDNPAAWRGGLKLALPASAKVRRVKHHAAESIDGMPAFMAALRQQEGVSARALEYTIFTAARTGEVLGARWGEIDLDARVWTVPASRMKAGTVHRAALSDPAIAILKAVRQGGGDPAVEDHIFPGAKPGKGLSSMALLMTLRRMGRDDLTVHGTARSTFRDWVAERTDFPSEAAEMALSHTVGDKVEAAYRRGDLLERRREMMAAWAEFCAGAGTSPGRDSETAR